MNGPAKLYYDATQRYRDYTAARAASQRLRSVLALIALEERCKQLGVGALPPPVMLTLQLLSDYKEMRRKKYYRKRGAPEDVEVMYSVIPFADLQCRCGHPVAALGADPVIARLSKDEANEAGVDEAVFCSAQCKEVHGRILVHYLREDLEVIGQ